MGAFAQNALSGQNQKPWSGKIGGHGLAPGHYRASLTGTDAAGRLSNTARLSFRIVKR